MWVPSCERRNFLKKSTQNSTMSQNPPIHLWPTHNSRERTFVGSRNFPLVKFLRNRLFLSPVVVHTRKGWCAVALETRDLRSHTNSRLFTCLRYTPEREWREIFILRISHRCGIYRAAHIAQKISFFGINCEFVFCSERLMKAQTSWRGDEKRRLRCPNGWWTLSNQSHSRARLFL
jgi:hypothetical protein